MGGVRGANVVILSEVYVHKEPPKNPNQQIICLKTEIKYLVAAAFGGSATCFR